MQRGLLCVREASDARDIEPLIGPVTTQRAEQLAALEVPEPDGPVIAATGQSAPIRTHLEGLHRPQMCLAHPHALSALELPPAQPAVTAPTDQLLSTRAPGHPSSHCRIPSHVTHARPPG